MSTYGNGGTKDTNPSLGPLAMTSVLLKWIQFRVIVRHTYVAKSLFSKLLIKLVAYVFTVLTA